MAGRCRHKVLAQGDNVVWPFDTPSGRVTITWCARCGAVKVSGLGPAKWVHPRTVSVRLHVRVHSSGPAAR